MFFHRLCKFHINSFKNLGDITKIGSNIEKSQRIAAGCISFVELVLCMIYGKYYIRGWSEANLLSVSFFICVFVYCAMPFFIKGNIASSLIKFDILSTITLFLIYLLGFKFIYDSFEGYIRYIAIFILIIIVIKTSLKIFNKNGQKDE